MKQGQQDLQIAMSKIAAGQFGLVGDDSITNLLNQLPITNLEYLQMLDAELKGNNKLCEGLVSHALSLYVKRT